jgi:hypothetical protein
MAGCTLGAASFKLSSMLRVTVPHGLWIVFHRGRGPRSENATRGKGSTTRGVQAGFLGGAAVARAASGRKSLESVATKLYAAGIGDWVRGLHAWHYRCLPDGGTGSLSHWWFGLARVQDISGHTATVHIGRRVSALDSPARIKFDVR